MNWKRSAPNLLSAVFGVMVLSVALVHCIEAKLKSGEYQCDPDRGLGCPEDFACLYTDSLSEYRCYELPLDCTDNDGDLYGPGCPSDDCDDTAPQITACQPNGCPIGWVHVEAGPFQMGCDVDDPCWAGLAHESPRHEVNLTAYCIMKTEVTVAEYRDCMGQGPCAGAPTESSGTTKAYGNWTYTPASRENHPLNYVTWFEAREFCMQWYGGDLPTEAQWEKAARGTDQRTYPWGDDVPDCNRCNFDSVTGDEARGCFNAGWGPATWSVGYLGGPEGDSFYGAKDMAGNVWEWTVDCYDATGYETCVGCTDPVNDCDNGNRVVRGGSAFRDYTGMRATLRDSYEEMYRSMGIGFRCVRTPVQ
jgi:formylglycine-generating enzyme required for sulfatase activity